MKKFFTKQNKSFNLSDIDAYIIDNNVLEIVFNRTVAVIAGETLRLELKIEPIKLNPGKIDLKEI
jgi:hypothetical protein